jgi:hypothetical protein
MSLSWALRMPSFPLYFLNEEGEGNNQIDQFSPAFNHPTLVGMTNSAALHSFPATRSETRKASAAKKGFRR